MQHIDTKEMSRDCEKRLLEVQYFLARDWTLDPEIYQACHHDAVKVSVFSAQFVPKCPIPDPKKFFVNEVIYLDVMLPRSGTSKKMSNIYLKKGL